MKKKVLSTENKTKKITKKNDKKKLLFARKVKKTTDNKEQKVNRNVIVVTKTSSLKQKINKDRNYNTNDDDGKNSQCENKKV